MPWITVRIALVVATLAWTTPGHGQTPSAVEAISAMPWVAGAGLRIVPGTQVTYWQSQRQMWLGGPEAARALTLSQGANLWPTAVGLAVDIDDGTVVIIEDADIGHVVRTDLQALQPDLLFSLLRRVTEAANPERRRNGVPAAELVGYAVEPRHDPLLEATYWAIRLRLGDGRDVINATAVRLTRNGYAALTWIGTAAQFSGRDTVETTLAPFSVNDGARYADYREGDPVADMDLDALVTRLAGGVPPSVITAVSVLKYAGALALLPLVFAGWRFFRR